MIRRQFIKLAALTGATGLASPGLASPSLASLGTLDALEKKETHHTNAAQATVTWRIQGFTCVTCAVGLETMLRRHKGVKSADASYPGSTVTIRFYPELVSETSLRSYITDIGFTATPQKG
jgi:copper chaperone CopZ